MYYGFCDKLSKMIHLAPTTKDCDAEGAAKLFINNVCKLHGCPREFISDRDTRFRSGFFETFTQTLKIKHGFSTAYHPQTDGQTERVNQVVEDYLRHFVDVQQSNWEDLLPMAEFAYNNSYHSATDTTPFFLNYGVEPLTPFSLLSEKGKRRQDKLLRGSPAAQALVHKYKDLPTTDRESTFGQSLSAKAFTDRIQSALAQAKKHLEAAQQRDKKYADRKRKHTEFDIGDQVLLSTANLKLKESGSRKLLPRYIGPFPITAKMGTLAYQLHLPIQLKRYHNVFHVSLLQKFVPGGNIQPPPLPEVIDGELEYEVDRILRHASTGKGKHKKHTFLVKWKGYSEDFATWESQSNMSHAVEAIQEYWDKHPS